MFGLQAILERIPLRIMGINAYYYHYLSQSASFYLLLFNNQ
jgi:hypothetical protein